MSERKRLIFTAIAVSLMGIVTGLFLGGGLLPSQAAQQLYDERTIQTITKTVMGHSHDDNIQLHQHLITIVVTTTEATPHGYFHDFTLTTASGITPAAPTASIPVPGANEVWAIYGGFKPGQITVPVGTTITWTNKDKEVHTVTSTKIGLFNESLRPNGSLSYTFTEPGTFEYYCEPHDYMTASITVK